MAAIEFQIPFVSLRTGTTYTVNVWNRTYVGNPTVLYGGAEPLTTEEDADDDPFTPIRTQSGYFRVSDNRRTVDGGYLTADWWKALIPKNDTQRYVTLTHMNGSTEVIDWQGFMQAQTFGSELYETVQEREFPIQCPLTILKAIKVPTNRTNIENFAAMLNYMISQMPQVTITQVVVQGGAHAREWLLKKFDWANFMDEGGEPDYTLYDALEDTCKFWGWTARIKGTVIYLTMADDTGERSLLTLTAANLTALANGTSTSAGTVTSDMIAVELSDSEDYPIFINTDNDDFTQRGANRAVVKADVNPEDTIVEVLPESVRESLDTSYTWHQVGDNVRVGYFESAIIGSFDAAKLAGTSDSQWSGYCRRIVYPEDDTDNGTYCDDIRIDRVPSTTPLASLRTKRMMNYSGGSIKISGTVWDNTEHYDWDFACVVMRLGVGTSADRTGAKWFYISRSGNNVSQGWGNSPTNFLSFIDSGGQFKGVATVDLSTITGNPLYEFPAVPVPTGIFGYLFLDIMGVNMYQNGSAEGRPYLQIADLKIEFTRDETVIPTNISTPVGRVVKKSREGSREYKASNENQTQGEWNADCIFASDNNSKYGYGLVMNIDYTFMTAATYTSGNERPEQHLANRVAGYWADAKRCVELDLMVGQRVNQSDATKIETITPAHKVTFDGTLFHPVSISRNWRDDITRMVLIEIPTAS